MRMHAHIRAHAAAPHIMHVDVHAQMHSPGVPTCETSHVSVRAYTSHAWFAYTRALNRALLLFVCLTLP